MRKNVKRIDLSHYKHANYIPLFALFNVVLMFKNFHIKIKKCEQVIHGNKKGHNLQQFKKISIQSLINIVLIFCSKYAAMN